MELWINYHEKRELYEFKDSIASISMGIGSAFIDLFMKAFVIWFYFQLYAFAPQSLIAFFDYHNWWAWVILLFADDFTFYWHHRMSHTVRLLWAAHVNHHSSQRYNLSTALRQSWAELVYKYFWWIWLPLIGFNPFMIIFMQSISLIYQFWIHTETIGKLGVIEKFMNTPSHHRVHHASNIKYLDRNHAGILIIWDKMFGTFEEENLDEKPVFGITNNIESYNPLHIASHEFLNIWKDFRSAPNWKSKLQYLFNAPGWSHNGP
ncbi:UNVERIFIED_CONTAM: hypothetical protein GTU68_057710, partial [Idotea baltica]|nr:hypothetical protein [Idotea baltica]